MRVKLLVWLFIMGLNLLAEAHEFWMQSEKFFFKSGEHLIVSFKVGENFKGEPWDLKSHRIERLELRYLNKISDLKAQVKEGVKENVDILLQEEGTPMVVMQSNNAYIELDGEKFNAYLKEDGLDEVYYEREKTNTLNKPSKELYSRHTKLFVQVGNMKDDTYKNVIGLPIEIVPEKNPCSLKVGDIVRFRILVEGKPLFSAKVKVWNRYNNLTTMQNIYSQKDGMIETRISNPGPWMVSVVRMVPAKDVKADWQSYWGSLVFGVQ